MLIGGMPIKQNFLTNSEGLIGACSMPLAATPAPAAAPVTARRLGCAGLPCDWLRRPALRLSPLAATRVRRECVWFCSNIGGLLKRKGCLLYNIKKRLVLLATKPVKDTASG